MLSCTQYGAACDLDQRSCQPAGSGATAASSTVMRCEDAARPLLLRCLAKCGDASAKMRRELGVALLMRRSLTAAD